jgi:hypothetical protein
LLQLFNRRLTAVVYKNPCEGLKNPQPFNRRLTGH